MEWNDFGVCTGQAVLNRFWVRIVQHNVLGEQKEANLTEAERIFQLGRHQLLVPSRRPDDGSAVKAAIILPRLFFQTSVWFALCEMPFSGPTFAMKASRLHNRISVVTNSGTSQKCEGGLGI